MSGINDKQISLGDLGEGNTALFVCDIQENFRTAMLNFDPIVTNTKKLIDGCTLLQVPIVLTEQYPERLGKTVAELGLSDNVTLKSEKTQFNMLTTEVEDILPTLCNGNLKSIILCGVESHVCIEQTAIALLARGYMVHVVADCVTSRTIIDRTLALKRLSQIGCFVSTVETVLFKLLKGKEHPQFKAMAALVKTLCVDTGLSSHL